MFENNWKGGTNNFIFFPIFLLKSEENSAETSGTACRYYARRVNDVIFFYFFTFFLLSLLRIWRFQTHASR